MLNFDVIGYSAEKFEMFPTCERPLISKPPLTGLLLCTSCQPPLDTRLILCQVGRGPRHSEIFRSLRQSSRFGQAATFRARSLAASSSGADKSNLLVTRPSGRSSRTR